MPTPAKTPVAAITHRHEQRTNIPTEELRDFVSAEEEAPQTLLYPRDPSLDPQLVWQGKDEQDRQDLAVPVVPLYIQEKIHPEALVADLRAATKRRRGGGLAEEEVAYQVGLFDDFDDPAVDFETRIDFYRHPQQWTNRMILGDSLLVMASLAEKEQLKGQVQCIYLDPPYGIKFGSNWQVSTRKRDVRDGKDSDLTRQPEQVRAFRDTWQAGVNTYLSYMRDRLTIAHELLSDSGSVFVQIGDENVHLVRLLLDEVFGSQNMVSQISFAKTTGFSGSYLSNVSDYILWYSKSVDSLKFRGLYRPKQAGEDGATAYQPISRLPVDREFWKDTPDSLLGTSADLTSQGASPGDQSIDIQSQQFVPPAGLHWKTTPEGVRRLIHAGRVFVVGKTPRYLRLLDDFPVFPINSTWSDTGVAGFTADKLYVVQTSTKVVERCILMTTDPGDLVLDPTCGSGTTAYVAEQWGRRWITIDTSRVALALARTRLMAAKYPWYLLADSAEGRAKEAERTGLPQPDSPPAKDVRKGFVYRRVPHVTLKSIANNPDIREGMTRAEIDAAIKRHAEFETLYDQPHDDKARVRVSGPFTVESVSPHRVLSAADEDLDGIVTPDERLERRDFTTMILDNLRTAGVQNTYKSQRIRFDRLEPYAGTWLQGEGEFSDAEGLPVRVAVSVGPEHGTVGPDHVKEAAKEAVRGTGFDLLLVCGFALDAHVNEEAKRYGQLTVLPTKMNMDLTMGDDLLKKTGAGNLFMVFGEPDVAIATDPLGNVTVELRGVDVYDPTTGEVRSNSTDEVACWFVDTDYNEESFFVRHAYFTGAGEPYDKLKRALKAEIDEDAWDSLYRTVSRPFPRPKSGKIAVKVINHYGDEVLKVFDVS